MAFSRQFQQIRANGHQSQQDGHLPNRTPFFDIPRAVERHRLCLYLRSNLLFVRGNTLMALKKSSNDSLFPVIFVLFAQSWTQIFPIYSSNRFVVWPKKKLALRLWSQLLKCYSFLSTFIRTNSLFFPVVLYVGACWFRRAPINIVVGICALAHAWPVPTPECRRGARCQNSFQREILLVLKRTDFSRCDENKAIALLTRPTQRTCTSQRNNVNA